MQSKKVNEASIMEIKEVFRLVMMKLGIRGNNLPSEVEKMVLLEHLCRQYGSHTLDEIKLAFDMAMVGKLDGEFRCYENFSCDYISLVMKAYRAWAHEEFKQLPAPTPPQKHMEAVSDFAMLKWLAREIQLIKTGKPFQFVPLDLYEWFDKRGNIKATPEEKRQYLNKAVAWRGVELQKECDKKNSVDNNAALMQFRAMRDEGCFRGAEIDRLKAVAKKLLFFDLAMQRSK